MKIIWIIVKKKKKIIIERSVKPGFQVPQPLGFDFLYTALVTSVSNVYPISTDVIEHDMTSILPVTYMSDSTYIPLYNEPYEVPTKVGEIQVAAQWDIIISTPNAHPPTEGSGYDPDKARTGKTIQGIGGGFLDILSNVAGPLLSMFGI